MGFLDKFFSGVNREPQKPSGVELELRRRLTVLVSDTATQNAPQRYFLRWEGQVQGVGFRFTNTNLAQVQGAPANILSHLEALHASYERMGIRFRLEDAQARATLTGEDGFDPHY